MTIEKTYHNVGPTSKEIEMKSVICKCGRAFRVMATSKQVTCSLYCEKGVEDVDVPPNGWVARARQINRERGRRS